ncbi:MAG TPA: RNA methyltransferase [Bacteroidales bacterium]|nr:MAG: tRNA (guanosine(18)-2'-O)-methyltransferase [Bacteroidetes bacterium ADurb.Bin041]HNV50065.1 RNA methyltransferase [Bacteroidales bacterium]HPW43040.1 RNA methyltransferase [Bacteroidales bacterium]
MTRSAELNQLIFNHLSTFITEHKLKRFDEVLKNRTRYITVVIEDVYQPHNASAVLRTCECFGIQDVHIIENQNTYTINPDIALGSAKWLSLFKYSGENNNTPTAIKLLKEKGYRIIATSPHSDNIVLEELSLEKGPVAVMFGTEMRGLTQTSFQLADEFIKIPMFGFTESFNISVSAALVLYHLTDKLRKSTIDWGLTENDMIDIRLQWAREVVKRSDLIERDFLSKNPLGKEE